VNNKKIQSGSAHLIVVILLVLALIGALGFVYYQNFIQKKASDTSTTDTTGTGSTITYKTYTDSLYNATFQYPDNWSVGTLTVSSFDPSYNRILDIKNDNTIIVATLDLGVSGIGGTCANENGVPQLTTITVLDSTLSSVKATKPVAASFIVTKANDRPSGYYAAYGLSDSYTAISDYNVCMPYITFETTSLGDNNDKYGIMFGNSGFLSASSSPTFKTKYFATLDDARAYIASNEYKEIKKMLLSLTY